MEEGKGRDRDEEGERGQPHSHVVVLREVSLIPMLLC